MIEKSVFHLRWCEDVDQRMFYQLGPWFYLWLVTQFSFVHGFLKYLPWKYELSWEGFHGRIKHFSNVESQRNCTFCYPWLQTRRIQAVAIISIASYFAFNWVLRDWMVHIFFKDLPPFLWKNPGKPVTVSQGCYMNTATDTKLLNAYD